MPQGSGCAKVAINEERYLLNMGGFGLSVVKTTL